MYRPRSSPYGDVYTIPTSTVDGIANRLYQEQRVREQQKLQQDKALDDEFAKNIAGVKSIDIPDITKAYNDFKQAHIALQKKGQKATPQDQMDVMVKKANAFSEIAASKEDKEYWATRAKDGKNNKRYNPNYQTVISEGLNTPTKNRKRDLDDDRLLYQYAMPNIDKWVLNAVGKGQEVPIEVGTDPNDPLKNKKEIYKTINPPNTFYNNLFNGIGSSPDNEGFTRFMLDKAYTDDEKEKLKIAYAIKTQDPKFKKLYGEVEPFPASAANTELGQAVALKTMEAFVNLPIDKPIRTQSVNDTEAVMDKRFRQQKVMEGIRQANRKELFGMREAAKAAGEEANDLWIDEYLNKTREEAKQSNKAATYTFANGNKINGYQVELDPVMSKALGFDAKNQGMLIVTNDGKFVPMFYRTDDNYNPIKKDDKFIIEPTKTNVLSQDAIKLALGGKAGVKQLNKEMNNQGKPNKPTTKKGKYD